MAVKFLTKYWFLAPSFVASSQQIDTSLKRFQHLLLQVGVSLFTAFKYLIIV